MTDEERQALIAKMQQANDKTKTMTKHQAIAKLQETGILNSKGKLHAQYGGKGWRKYYGFKQ